MADKKDKRDNRNADLDKGLPRPMFGPMVTGAQDYARRQHQQQANGK